MKERGEKGGSIEVDSRMTDDRSGDPGCAEMQLDADDDDNHQDKPFDAL